MSGFGVIVKIEEISKIGEAEFSTVEWRNFGVLNWQGGNHDKYQSPPFSIGNTSWCLWLYPRWKMELGRPSSGLLRIDVHRCDGGPPKTFHVIVGIKVTGGQEKVKEVERVFSADDCDYHRWDDFCSRSYLEKHIDRLMPDCILAITCTIKLVGAATGDDVLQKSEQNVLESSKNFTLKEQGSSNDAEGNYDDDEDGEDDNDKASSIKDNIKQQDQAKNAKKRFETLVKDFSKLLSSGEGSDVTVQVDDAEFLVHRNILSARSPVLSAMFKHETEERDTNKITICDCEPHVFKEYLKYLYTGSVEHLSEQNVFHLFRIADKYLAEELKEQCLMHIRDTLSVQTFCDTVKLALTYEQSGLLQQAIDFATENIRSIICTVEWQNFIREYPTEANEVLIKSLGPQCACQKSKQ